jgi:hypothetical protein
MAGAIMRTSDFEMLSLFFVAISRRRSSFPLPPFALRHSLLSASLDHYPDGVVAQDSA